MHNAYYIMAGSAAEMLLVSLSCPLPLLRTHPPSLLVCCFLVFAEMGATSTASRVAGGKTLGLV
jgi:hypothetical protein